MVLSAIQLPPLSQLCQTPPSLPSTMWLGSPGSIHCAWLSTWMPWSPARTGRTLSLERSRGGEVRDEWGFAGGDGDADRPFSRLGEAAALDLGPGGAGVGALPERAAGAAALQEVGTPPPLPTRGVEGVRVRRVHRHVHEARLV